MKHTHPPRGLSQEYLPWEKAKLRVQSISTPRAALHLCEGAVEWPACVCEEEHWGYPEQIPIFLPPSQGDQVSPGGISALQGKKGHADTIWGTPRIRILRKDLKIR